MSQRGYFDKKKSLFGWNKSGVLVIWFIFICNLNSYLFIELDVFTY